MIRSLILVSGAPGSGKTTLAKALSEALGFTLISKDAIKEALEDALPGRHTSTELSDAAMAVLWSLAADAQQAILEANFHPAQSCERLCAVPGRKLEIHCVCPLEICAERYAQRATSQHHHRVHPKSISIESLQKYAVPIGACPVIEVNTLEPVNVGEVLNKVRRHWPETQG